MVDGVEGETVAARREGAGSRSGVLGCQIEDPSGKPRAVIAPAGGLTPEYLHFLHQRAARAPQCTLVHPASSIVVKPSELQSTLSRLLNVARYKPERDGTYLAATLAFGLINGA